MYVNNIEPEMVLPPGSESFNHNATRSTSSRSRSNNVNNNTVCVYSTVLWRDFVTGVSKKYEGLCKVIVISNLSGVCITAMQNVAEEVAHMVQMFLAEHAIIQTTMTTIHDLKSEKGTEEEVRKILDQTVKELQKHCLKPVLFIPVYRGAFAIRFIVTVKGTVDEGHGG